MVPPFKKKKKKAPEEEHLSDSGGGKFLFTFGKEFSRMESIREELRVYSFER